MADSAKRIGAWIKSHPWLAAVILGGVVLAGYFIYKSRGASSASQDQGVVTDTGLASGGGGAAEDNIPDFIPTDIAGSMISGGEFSLPSDVSGLTSDGFPSSFATPTDLFGLAKQPKVGDLIGSAQEMKIAKDSTPVTAKTLKEAAKTMKAINKPEKLPGRLPDIQKSASKSEKSSSTPIEVSKESKTLFGMATSTFNNQTVPVTAKPAKQPDAKQPKQQKGMKAI
jgi:hypothetical protein